MQTTNTKFQWKKSLDTRNSFKIKGTYTDHVTVISETENCLGLFVSYLFAVK